MCPLYRVHMFSPTKGFFESEFGIHVPDHRGQTLQHLTNWLRSKQYECSLVYLYSLGISRIFLANYGEFLEDHPI